MTVEASSSKCAHPPRSKTPRSSSSGPPGPCITPSTETCVVVVSLIGPTFLWWFPRDDRTEARIPSTAPDAPYVSGELMPGTLASLLIKLGLDATGVEQ